ncbi:MAG: M48 family metallopeptidase [Oligoflexia bacterium]|nr:M48 family metallopeptidase [Oligoflexia bacterium]
MNAYVLLILGLAVGNAFLDILIERLNHARLSPQLPAEFEGLYDETEYARSIEYQAASARFDIVRGLVMTGAFLAFWFSGGFAALDRTAGSLQHGPVATGLIFFGILAAFQGLLSLPFAIYSTFVIEQKFGFNRTTPRTFAADRLKGILLAVILGGPALAAILWIFERFGSGAWLPAWFSFTAVQLLLLFLAPIVILPLFNSYVPMPPGELKNAIEALARKQDFALGALYQMDGSRRSSKSNAFFTGFGRFRRLVLFDTLIEKHTREELLGVLAHEIGHFKLKHIPRSIAFSLFSSMLLFWFLSLFLGNREAVAALGFANVSVHASLLVVGFLYSPVSRALSIIGHALSRKHEFEADRYAREACGNPEALVSALKKLSRDNFSHLTPHPLKVFVEYTHPPVLRRIEALRS